MLKFAVIYRPAEYGGFRTTFGPAETVVLADEVAVEDGNLVFYRKPYEICHIVVQDQWSEVKLIENTAPASNAAEPERRWPIKP